MTKNTTNKDKFTVRDFFKKFPNEDVCLDHLLEVRFGMKHECGQCKQVATFHKIEGRKAYECSRCRCHLYPCAGTIFQDSHVSLQSWFYAIYLFTVTRHGVSGKELQRTLGVAYRTAWRMGQQIRTLMKKADGFKLMQGHIEIDECYVGAPHPGKKGRGAAGKTIVMGLVERNGRMVAKVIPNIKSVTLQSVVHANVEQGATISTDELNAYSLLKWDGFEHGTVKHGDKQYVQGEHHVNSVESFWRLFKYAVRSTHIHVSKKYMQKYLDEFSFRANHRKMQSAMFDLLLGAV